MRSRGNQEPAAHQMADAEQLLRRDPSVGNDTHHCGHEQRRNTHRGKETSDLQPCEVEATAKVGAQRDEPRTPDGILEEVHDDKAEFNSHNSLILGCFYLQVHSVGK